MSYDRTERIRRAAILVACLDEPLAERLLADLPPTEAARVFAEAEQLEAIDPEEQQDVLAEFRRLTRGKRPADDAVEFNYSGDGGQSVGESSVAPAPQLEETPAASPAMSEGDAAAMAELLAGEHPQIVAAALSRLGDEQSAAVFAVLPAELQSETLERLSALAPADEDAVQEVELQLQQRMNQRREHQARSAAGAEMVRKILARTPASQRAYLLGRIAKNPATPTAPPAGGMRSARFAPASRIPDIDPVAQQAINLASAVRRAQGQTPEFVPPPAPPIDDPSDELDLLGDESLVAGLRASSEATVLRALAASSEMFLQRVLNMLPRRQAKQLRRMLRNLGPTRLTDLHQAQHELLRRAHELTPETAAA